MMTNQDRPIRIQRRRAKGWRLPPNTVCVTRPGPHGNPFDLNVIDHAVACGLVSHGEPADFDPKAIIGSDAWFRALAETAVLLFRRYVELMPDDIRTRWLAPLRGKNQACWCRLDMPCHADVLLEIANRDTVMNGDRDRFARFLADASAPLVWQEGGVWRFHIDGWGSSQRATEIEARSAAQYRFFEHARKMTA